MKWNDRSVLPDENRRILTYSPQYISDEMRYRLIDAQFLRLCREVTHWCYATPPTSDQEEAGQTTNQHSNGAKPAEICARQFYRKAAKMVDTKGDLIKIASQILIGCPISTCVEDWQLPKYVSGRQLFLIRQRLDKLDSWLKSMCIKVRIAADTMDGSNPQTTNTGSPKLLDELEALVVSGESNDRAKFKRVQEIFKQLRAGA